MSESVERQIISPAVGENAPSSLNQEAAGTTSQGTEALKDITFGSAAGIIGKIIEYPFDTVKVRLQSQPSHLPLLYTGPLDCLRQSLHSQGISSLYQGISAPLLGAAIETSSLFFSYRLAQDALQATFFTTHSDPVAPPLPLPALVTCGAASGAFTSLLLTPIELIKCQMQVSTTTIPAAPQNTSNPLSIIASTYRYHGLRGFWHGQLGTLIRETGGSAAWFGSYEGVSALLRAYRSPHPSLSSPPSSNELSSSLVPPLPVWQQMLAGATAGVSYNFVFYPADTIKSRMQTEELMTSGTRGTFWEVGRKLWREHGIGGLYRGCGITVGRAAPSSAFIFAVYEGLRGLAG